jgi:hypothetical protein
LWLVPFFGAIMLVVFVAFPGFWPPMSPAMTAEQVSAFYAQHTAMIRFSMITFNLCAIMLIPFFMTIAVQIKRMSLPSHVLAYSYLAAASTGATLFAIADIFWLIAAYRPARNPELILLLNDMAWLVFIAPVGAVVVMNLSLALADLPALGRTVQPGGGGRHDARGVCGDLHDRTAGVERRDLVLAPSWRVRGVHRRDVLRGAVGDKQAGVGDRR